MEDMNNLRGFCFFVGILIRNCRVNKFSYKIIYISSINGCINMILKELNLLGW